MKLIRQFFATMLALLLLAVAASVSAADVEEGKRLAWDRSKGNCLACHAMQGGDQAGNIGPPLIAMKARFPDREVLWNRIYDARSANEITRMPPFGEHGILTYEEIDKIVDYLYKL